MTLSTGTGCLRNNFARIRATNTFYLAPKRISIRRERENIARRLFRSAGRVYNGVTARALENRRENGLGNKQNKLIKK